MSSARVHQTGTHLAVKSDVCGSISSYNKEQLFEWKKAYETEKNYIS